MSIQNRPEFLDERTLAVMLWLTLNIGHRAFNIGDADAERAVSFLPREAAMLWEGVVYPFRRIPFEELHGLSDRQR